MTLRVLELLAGKVEDTKARWADGCFTDQGQFGTAILNAEAIGNCRAWGLILTLEYEDLLSEGDYEQQRTATVGQSSTG